ncbi:TPA: hypothetical protein UMT86_001371 [Stenotrophomonas maltophilia]|nr:hypothetical protein [Stenotrophomonas maltophilia]
MDMASIGTAFSAIDLIRKGLVAAVEVRDFNKAATELAKLNEALISAQTALLAQNSALFDLQREKFESAEKLRKLEEALTERGRYSLVELADGYFAYLANVTPKQSGTLQPGCTEPVHYICQPCFDGGKKGVLQRYARYGSVHLRCPICTNEVDTGERYNMSL